MEPGVKAAGLAETWKQWEGNVLNGEFPLQRYLGGSAHSAVFLTERPGQEPQKAAIKLLPANPQDAEKQLLRWRLATKLPHSHLLRIFEVGRCELGGTPLLYAVMEYADEDLSQVLPHRPLTSAEAKEVLRAVIDVLAYVHSKGFVHGGLKPANILAVGDRIKLSSDSLCAVADAACVEASPRSAPELAQGAVSTAADVWALAMTLAEILTQRVPQSDASKEPALPKAMPEPFRDIASHCLRFDPQQRWTAAQIAKRLESPSSQASTAPDVRRKVDWRYVVPVAVAVLALIMLAGSRKRSSQPQSEPVREKAPQAVTTLPAPAQQKPTPAISAPLAAQREPGAPQPTSPPPETATTAALAPGAVIRQVLPEVSPRARATIQGRVRVSVRVAVDASGNVSEATLESPGPSKYFARLALQAAHEWKFTPAQSAGGPVPSQWSLRFAFGRTDTTVVPRPAFR